MKIIHIGVGFSIFGGVESVIVNLANEMSESHDVTVCSVFKPAEDGPFYTRFSPKVTKENLGVIKNGFSLRNIWKIFWYIKQKDVDIVHIHGFFYYYILPILLLRNKKYVYTVHSDAKMESTKWDKRVQFLKRWCFKKHFMYPITISQESKKSFYNYYHLNSKLINNCIAKPNVIGTCPIIEESRISNNTKIFFHPARISAEKNQVVLCKVFQKLIADGFDVVLLIAGSVHEEDVFNDLVPFLCNRIKYIGESNDVPLILANSNGFCLPSIWEGLPITLLEALSVGCIPICSPVGGIVNVIENGKNGLLSISSKEEDYYQAMRFYLNLDNEEIQEMKNKCLQSFHKFDIKQGVKEHIEYYSSIILSHYNNNF